MSLSFPSRQKTTGRKAAGLLMKSTLNLSQIKGTLLADLKCAAVEGRVTSKKPITATRMCRIYRERYGWKLSGEHIRDMVNDLRSEGNLIGSSTKGYWYIVNGDGEQHTANQLESRILHQFQALVSMWPERKNGILFRLILTTVNKHQ